MLLATNGLGVTIPLYLAQGIDALSTPNPGPQIAHAALVVALMGVALIVVRTASRVLFFTPGRLVEAQLKHDLFARLLTQQPAFLAQWPTGDLISRASSDLTYLRLLAGFSMLSLVNTLTALTFSSVQMLRLSPRLALLVVLPVLLGLGVTLSFVRHFHTLVLRSQGQTAALSDFILSAYQGVASVQGHRAEPHFLTRFGVLNRDLLRTTLKFAQLRAVVGPVLALTASFNVFLLLWVGGPMALHGEISVGELIAFTSLVAYLALPLRGFTFLLSTIKQAQAAHQRVFAVLDPEPDRPDLPNPIAAPVTPPGISLRQLSFAYPSAPERQVLDAVSVEVPSGGTLGLFGPTGSGKSTLLALLARLYNPPEGSVFVNGVDLRQLDLDGWRKTMVLVPQRPFLFSDTLRDNILLGLDDDHRLQAAVDHAALGPDLAALPHGLDTHVGERGVTLSGGQRQRAALARALRRAPQLLLLDDVLSAVDHATERALLQTLRGAAQVPTTVLVSHRISALQHADIILVLDHGRLLDQGTHRELISRPGLYQATWQRQRAGHDE